MTEAQLPASLRDAVRAPFWTDRADAPAPRAPIENGLEVDLLIVGGGFTGLWTAWRALDRDPARSIAIVDAETIGFGASGRNGGFVSASLTHGLAHGEALWPRDMPAITREGRANLEAMRADLEGAGIDCGFSMVGKTTLAIEPWHVPHLQSAHELALRYGEDAEWHDREQVQADVHSPTYLAGLRVRTGNALVDPARMAWGMAAHLERRGVQIFDRSRVTSLRRDGAGVISRQADGSSVRARHVVVATAAYRSPLRRLGGYIMPLYDHVLMTEPLTPEQRSSLGWAERQGLTDAGNQFHYYRLTDDERVLWGGWDAVYHRGGRIDPALDYAGSSHALLARQFAETFPQLRDVRFSHMWAGPIDSTTRFTAAYGTAVGGSVAYAIGHTGLGVGAARFSADVALDLLERADSARVRYGIVRRRPIPIPPEPLRNPIIQFTRRSIINSDAREGRRNLWLRTLDRLGLGFTS
ncbi:MAG: FAD-dependent oxidoreductase [Microcella sp.]|uniref:NAD(P)/FAD-dependent oxidoreductase n=1 Tax=Microcella sp. TaxID=1913979 RepID=UPI0024C54107|nr:FAD-dependent oxidoreductase [Microcella sp.]UYN84241.1 MAG: FAD-dependent oxidoreductase [Microcella sp.]